MLQNEIHPAWQHGGEVKLIDVGWDGVANSGSFEAAVFAACV